jgi:hypothetical protein
MSLVLTVSRPGLRMEKVVKWQRSLFEWVVAAGEAQMLDPQAL